MTISPPRYRNCTFVVIFAFMLMNVAFLHAQQGEQKEGAEGGGPPQGPPPAMVRVAQIEQQTMQNRWSVVGRLREIKRSTVAAEQEGRVIEVDFEEGDAVHQGETVLARIDPVWAELALRSAKAQLGEGQASVAEAEALLDQAKRDLEQIRGLYESRTLNRKELDDALSRVRAQEARLASSHARVASAEASVGRAEENVARLAVVAPFDGTVVRKMVEVGQWVGPGADIAEIVSRGAIDAVIDVPETMVNNLVLDQPLSIQLDGQNIDVEGKVIAVVPLGSSAARTFPVHVRIDDLDGKLKPGMSVTAAVPMGEERAFFTVPRDAVVRTLRGVVIWIDGGGMALPVPVRVLFNVGDTVAIESKPGGQGSELMAGTTVVIEGAERLFPTQPLMILNPDALGTGKQPERESTQAQATP